LSKQDHCYEVVRAIIILTRALKNAGCQHGPAEIRLRTEADARSIEYALRQSLTYTAYAPFPIDCRRGTTEVFGVRFTSPNTTPAVVA